MKTMQRRAALLLALLLTTLLAITACSAPDEDENTGAPIQVNTPQGQVTIEGTPKRIVTLGNQWIDTALAFGVTPVAYLDQNKITSGSSAPWVGDKLANSTELNAEDLVADIAKAEPDLILAEGYMVTAQPETFEKLSKIAPTIPGITGKQIDPWQDQVTLFGTLTRQPEKATEITDEVNAKVADVKKQLPGLEGKTYALAFMFSSEEIQVMADPTDGAGLLFAELGLQVAPKLAAEFAKTQQPRFPISTENVPMLEGDLLAITASNEQLQAQLVKLPGYSTLPQVRNGTVVDLTLAEITGLNQPSPLAIPYLLDKLFPTLQKVAGE